MKAIVIGASGGIGSALAAELEARGALVVRLSRSGDPAVDLDDEPGIAAAADRLAGEAPFDLVLIATGLLHGDGIEPEKSRRAIRSIAASTSTPPAKPC